MQKNINWVIMTYGMKSVKIADMIQVKTLDLKRGIKHVGNVEATLKEIIVSEL